MDIIFSKDILVREILSPDMALHVDHIMFFQNLMMQNFGYPFFCSNNDLQAPRNADVQALNTDKRISLKPMSVNEMDIHHWVCSYYNGHQIFIFDTLSTIKTGHINYELVLGNLFPSYFEIGGSIEYPQV